MEGLQKKEKQCNSWHIDPQRGLKFLRPALCPSLCLSPPHKETVNGPFYLFSVTRYLSRAPDTYLKKNRKNILIAPTIFFFFFFYSYLKTFQSKVWLGWTCRASSARTKSRLITLSLMLELIRIVPPAGTAHMATLPAVVEARLADDLLRGENSSQRIFGLCCSNICNAPTQLPPPRAGKAETACNWFNYQ